MNIAAHNPKFLNGLSITKLLSRIAILTSQLDGAKKQITTMTSQIMDLTNRCNSADKKNMDLTSQNTAYLQRINELERSATLDSNNSCKPPSSDGLRKPNGKRDKDKQRLPLTFELASLATTLGVRHGLVILDAQQYHSGGCLVGGTSVKGGIVFERVLICYGPVGNISASSGLFILLDMAR